MAHQEERRRALQDDIEHEVAQWRDELADERAAIEAKLADLHQCESALEAYRAMTVDHMEQKPPTFTKASQNMADAPLIMAKGLQRWGWLPLRWGF
jgi:hypothetical protein